MLTDITVFKSVQPLIILQSFVISLDLSPGFLQIEYEQYSDRYINLLGCIKEIPLSHVLHLLMLFANTNWPSIGILKDLT